MNILKIIMGIPPTRSQTDTTADSPDPLPGDIWAFTDPDARAAFIKDGRLAELEHDIRFEVLRGEDWLPEELEYKCEIRRLLKMQLIADKSTYWYASPFPTVYRAIRNGSLTIAGQLYRFQEDDDIVFQCRMSRDMNSEVIGPVLIDRLQPTHKTQLCGQMGSAMKGLH